MSSKPSLDVVTAIWKEKEVKARHRVAKRVIALFKDAGFYEPVTPEEVADEIVKLVIFAFYSLHFPIDSKGN